MFLPVPGLAVMLACAAECAAGAKQAEEVAAKVYLVRFIQDVAYNSGPGADKTRHKLDLYLPRGRKDFPVLFFVHGGAWMQGDKDFFGRHKPVGMFFASRGIGVVMANYRLSPQVQHPVHVQDVAKAFAWTHKNIRKYGGRPDEVVVMGHSAGAHLASLLATDDTYLKAEGLGLHDIVGVIAMSGVYHIPEKNALFDKIFGVDPKVRQGASPVSHARPDAPPFLIMWAADHEFFFCGKKPSEEFARALRDKKVPVELLEVKHRGHVGELIRATRDDDPAAKAILGFVHLHTNQ
jgi:acetyl esterase/lipase